VKNTAAYGPLKCYERTLTVTYCNPHSSPFTYIGGVANAQNRRRRGGSCGLGVGKSTTIVRIGRDQHAELRRIKRLIALLPDHELARVLADYEYLAALEPNADSYSIRDACRQQVNRRSLLSLDETKSDRKSLSGRSISPPSARLNSFFRLFRR